MCSIVLSSPEMGAVNSEGLSGEPNEAAREAYDGTQAASILRR